MTVFRVSSKVNRLGWLLTVIMVCSTLPTSSALAGSRRPSSDIPLHHWVYDALDQFAGLDSTVVPALDNKPLTREDVAEIVARLKQWPTIMTPGLRMTLASLAREFARELDRQGGSDRLHLGPVRVDRSYCSVRVPFIRATRSLQKNIDPYTRYEFQRGSNFGAEIDVGITINDRVLLFLSPSLLANESGIQGRMEQWTARTRVWGIDAEVGRTSVSWGPGYRGNFVLSDNAPPATMLRISRHGSAISGTFLVSRESDHDPTVTAGTMVGVHLDWTIRHRLTIGASATSIFSDLTLSKFFAPNLTNPDDNRVAEITGSLYLTPTIKLYGVTAGDDFFRENFPKRIIPWGRRSAYLAGIYLGDVLHDGTTDLRVEVAHLKEELQGEHWYIHSRYDYLRRGWIMGHPMARFITLPGGGDRTKELDVFVRLTHRWSDRSWAGVAYDRQTADVRRPLPIRGIPNPNIDLDDAVSFLAVEASHQLGRRWTWAFTGTWYGTLQLVKGSGATWGTTMDRVIQVNVMYRVL